jgi:hypothetical protein
LELLGFQKRNYVLAKDESLIPNSSKDKIHEMKRAGHSSLMFDEGDGQDQGSAGETNCLLT